MTQMTYNSLNQTTPATQPKPTTFPLLSQVITYLDVNFGKEILTPKGGFLGPAHRSGFNPALALAE